MYSQQLQEQVAADMRRLQARVRELEKRIRKAPIVSLEWDRDGKLIPAECYFCEGSQPCAPGGGDFRILHEEASDES